MTVLKEALPAGLIAPVRIAPSRGWWELNLQELWEYRELLYFFVWRDVKVRYKQTVIGAGWALIQPFFTMVVFSIFFGRLARIPSDGVPYPVFAFTGLVPWMYFANTLSTATNSVVEHQRVITKVYFPRLILPVSAALSGLVDLSIAFVLLIGMVLFYGITPTRAIWTIPLFVLLATFTALGVGIWLSALNAEYRDIRYAIPFLIQIWLFATPIAYPSSLVPVQWRAFYGLNPMAGVVEGFRWALLEKRAAPGAMLAVSVACVVLLVVGSVIYFQRREKVFVDVV